MKIKIPNVGNWSRELYETFFIKKNTGAYGQVALPDESNVVTILGDASVDPEKAHEQNNAKSNSRLRLESIIGKGQTKIGLPVNLDASGDATKEWKIGTLLELLLGKRTVVGATVGATASISDPAGTKAGLIVTTAAAYNGHKGNQVDIKFVRGGASGSAALDATKAPHYVVTYYDNDPVSEIVAAIDGDANLVCVDDGNGDDSTDLFVDLLVADQKESGAVIQCANGANEGFQYDNSVPPSADATIVSNSERFGRLITGGIVDKCEIEIGDKAPTAKFEIIARYTNTQGICQAAAAVVSDNKIYITDEKQFADVDPEAPQYINVVDNDRVTRKATARQVLTKGYDTGWYITVSGAAFSCDEGDYVCFYTPLEWKPKIAPLNGLEGSLTIDGQTFDKIKNLKINIENNHQILDNLALSKTIQGFIPSKFMNIKLSGALLVQSNKLELFRAASSGTKTFSAPVVIELGSVAGKCFSIVLTKVEFKYPKLSNKAEEVKEVTIEAEAICVPDIDAPEIYAFTH